MRERGLEPPSHLGSSRVARACGAWHRFQAVGPPTALSIWSMSPPLTNQRAWAAA